MATVPSPKTGQWPMATGYWLLATGYWLLAAGYWLLATGYWQTETMNYELTTVNCPSLFPRQRLHNVSHLLLLRLDVSGKRLLWLHLS